MMENFNLMEQLDKFNNSSIMVDTTHNLTDQTEEIK